MQRVFTMSRGLFPSVAQMLEHESLLYIDSLFVHLIDHAGRREWGPIQKWCHINMETALKAWFGNVEVVREGTSKFDPNDRFIFGYTPHGLFPIGKRSNLKHSKQLSTNITDCSVAGLDIVYMTCPSGFCDR